MPAPFDAQITFFRTTDLERTHTFYTEVLELPLVLDQGVCRIYGVHGRAFVGFCENASQPPADGVILTLVTDDVDGWHTRLLDAGATIETAPRYNERFRIFQLIARDPNGYLLEIQRFEDERWPRVGSAPVAVENGDET